MFVNNIQNSVAQQIDRNGFYHIFLVIFVIFSILTNNLMVKFEVIELYFKIDSVIIRYYIPLGLQ